jgi:hypothetical protein
MNPADKPKLKHNFHGSREDFFREIDKHGGWPPAAKSVVLSHASPDRECYFSVKENIRDEWNTSLATADEYFLWKLSPKFLEELKTKLRQELRGQLVRHLAAELHAD